MSDVSNLKMNDRSNIEGGTYELLKSEIKIEKLKLRNWFTSKNKSESRPNSQWCGISNERTTPKFANFGTQILFLKIEKILEIC